jgi:diguanylate cyclase (GGDEF)-like protein
VSFDDRRLEAIAQLGLLERSGDPGLTAITRLAGYVTGARAAAIHVLDAEAQHRVAATDAPLGAHPLADAMCRLVLDGEQRIVCADAATDPRFSYSSLVQGLAPVRFYASVPIELTDGTIIGTLCSWDTEPRALSGDQVERLDDLAEQAAARIELMQLARTLGEAAAHDPLTGLVNRLLLFDRLAQAFARRRRHGGHVAVALVDVDDFKAVNDRHGHLVGDRVLQAVASRMAGTARPQDLLVRLGGDEFALWCPDLMAPGEAEDVAARLVEVLERPVVVEDETVPLGCSVGLALVDGPVVDEADVDRILGQADRALYRAKRTGKHRWSAEG